MSDSTDSALAAGGAMDTKYCTNCKRDIAAGNFIMHEVHCRRNITLCSDCQEPVPRSEMDAHFEEYHKQVPCKCGESIEISQLEEHQKNHCKQRMKKCEYCELELPHSEMENHANYCGTRTECCPRCKRYIQVRDQDQHDITNCAFPEQKPPTNQTTSRGAFFDMDDGYDETTLHAITNRFMFPEYVDPSSLRSDSGSMRTTRNVNLNSALGLNIATEGSRQANGESRSRRQRKNQDRVQNIYKNTNQRKPVASKKKDSSKPSNTTTADQLEADRLMAMRLANEDEDNNVFAQDWSTPPDSLTLPAEPSPRDRESENLQDLGLGKEELEYLLNEAKFGTSPPPRQISPPRQRASSFSRSRQFGSDDGVDEAGTQSNVVMAPCEFCNKTFPLEDLILHQTGCELDSLDRGFEPSSPVRAPSNNQRNSSQSSAPTQTPVVDNLRGTTTQRLIGPDPGFQYSGSSDEGSVMLPCEFCGDLLPGQVLPYHQYHCRETRSSKPKPPVQSSLQESGISPSNASVNRRSSKLAKSSGKNKPQNLGSGGGAATPPKQRSSRRRQEDLLHHNLFQPSDSSDQESERKNSPSRQSLKVKRSLSHSDQSAGTGPYSRTSAGNQNSSRTRQGSESALSDVTRTKKTSRGGSSNRAVTNDGDDFLLMPDPPLSLDTNRIHSLPLTSSNKVPNPRKTSKKFTNSDYANENFFTNPSGFQHVHPTRMTAPRSLNNSNKRLDREDSNQELLSQFDDRGARTKPENRRPSGGPKKSNAGRAANHASSFGGRSGAGAGYVPSFAGEDTRGTRPRKQTNSSSVKLAPSFSAPVDNASQEDLDAGFESAFSVSRPRGTSNRPPSKGRSRAERRPSSPS